MRRREAAVVLDLLSALVLGVGISLVAMPLAAHLLWGIENDSVIRVIEYGREHPFVQSEFGWERVELISVVAGIGLVSAGAVARWLAFWRRLR